MIQIQKNKVKIASSTPLVITFWIINYNSILLFNCLFFFYSFLTAMRKNDKKLKTSILIEASSVSSLYNYQLYVVKVWYTPLLFEILFIINNHRWIIITIIKYKFSAHIFIAPIRVSRCLLIFFSLLIYFINYDFSLFTY